MRAISKAELAALCESQGTELKKSLALQREALEALCGMINSDRASGRIIFGLAPDGTPVGVEPGNLDTAQRTLAESAKRWFDPPLHMTIDAIDCDGVKLIIVEATRSPSVPLHEFDGRAFVREGSSKRRLGLDERTALTRRRDRASHPGPWRCTRCGILVGDLRAFEVTATGMQRTFKCQCGGEYWPAS